MGDIQCCIDKQTGMLSVRNIRDGGGMWGTGLHRYM
jgi:hypothetical protein